MVKLTHFVTFLFIFKILVNFGVQAQPPVPPVPPFQFFWFVLTWTSSLCNDYDGCRMNPPPQDFTIHGLWPDNLDGPYLSNCTSAPYVPMQNPSLSKLPQQWPNVRGGAGRVSNEQFWRYEWNKNGVCSLFFYDQESYFLVASKLKDKFGNVLEVLRNNGTRPGTGRPFSLNKIRNNMKAMTQMDPDLVCNKDHRGNYQLLEIRFCIHANGDTIVNCPAPSSSQSCSATRSALFPLIK